MRATSPPRLATILLLPTLVLWAVLGCGRGSASSADASGEELYGIWCASCHGGDGRGFMGLGSSFAGVRQFWEEDDLLEYIADPKAFAAGDPRLGRRPMAAINATVPDAARERLVAHALSLMD